MDLSEIISKYLEEIKIKVSFFIGKIFADDSNYVVNFLKWVSEIITKNTIIYKKKNANNIEMQRRRRGRIYWIDFGKNVGSEYNDFHFAVVIYESKYTAIVVPLTSEKDQISNWIEEEKLIIPIGKLNDLPEKEKKNNYALIHQMRAVSKQRLSNFKYKDQYLGIKLMPSQMDSIDEAIMLNIIKKSK